MMFSETKLISDAIGRVREVLPVSWTVTMQKESARGTVRPDAILEFQAPDGKRATIIVEVKRRIDPKDVPSVLAQVARYGPGKPLVVSPFFSPRTRDVLAEAGANYLDPTGNLRLAIDRPALFVLTTGSDSDPWREKRPLRSLKGPAAGRVVRALCDFRPPIGIRELAERANIPPGTVSRTASFLDGEALVKREGRGRIVEADWAGLIRRWTQDYSLLKSNQTESVLAPRGLAAVTDRLRTVEFRYAVTASFAASQLVPVAPARLLVAYVVSSSEATEQLDLRPTEAGANVILAVPFDPVVFERTQRRDGIICAAASQVAADLLTSPGRGPTEGEELLKWMADHESEWR
jgi:hypothetical protein